MSQDNDRRRPVIEELEPRILYSADLSPVLPSVPVIAEQRTLDAAGEYINHNVEQQTSVAAEHARREIVFVDAAAPDYQGLVDDVRSQSTLQRQLDVVVLDSTRDGIAQITATLAGAHDVDAIHIISHGASGATQVGSTQIDANAIDRNAAQIQSWAGALSADGDVLLYGCDVAQTPDGKAMVDALARLSGADVAASVDVTGNESLGGDWDLEYHSGLIETAGIVSPQEQTTWAHLLEDAPHDITTAPPQSSPAHGGSTSATLSPSTPTVAVASPPLVFEADVGQAGGNFDFIAHGNDYALGLDQGNATIGVDNGSSTSVVQLTLVGKNVALNAQAEGLLESKTNYLVGTADQWRQDIANYSGVQYRNVYDGIDLRYYGTERQLEYDFIVNPGAQVDTIQLRFDGAKNLAIANNGDLILTLDDAGHTIEFKAPVAYQNGAYGREAVDSHYTIAADGTIGFATGLYDTSRSLVIDPVLSYGSYFGGTSADAAAGIAVDAAGNVYITGYVSSTTGLLGTILGAGTGEDVFVTKFSPDLSTRVYSAYVGGGANDRGTAIAVDASGNAYVTGYTKSTDFGTVSAYDSARGGAQDAFVFKLNAAGTALVYSTYLGGSGGTDVGYGITVDSSGSAYVTGFASSADFPTTAGAADTTYAGGEAFVTKLGVAGNTLAYSTFVGGTGSDTGHAITLDLVGNPVVVGETTSSNFFTTAGAFQSTSGGSTDVFVSRLDSTGSSITYSTYLGGNDVDIAYAAVVGPTGRIYVTGTTVSSNFDITSGAFQTVNPGRATFMSVLDPAISGSGALIYSTFLNGGGNDDAGTGIGVDGAGKVYVGGHSDANPGSQTDGFVAQINPAGGGVADRTYIAFLGKNGKLDEVNAAVYANGKFYVAGDTASSSGIATAGSYDTTFSGSSDAFTAVYTFNTPPVLTGTSATLAYSENSGKVAVHGAILVSDADSATLVGASVQITGNYVNGEDVLDFNNANPWGISAVWVAATGSLTMTGNATVGNYQSALRTVTYENISEKPSTLARSVTFIANDGVFASSSISRSISVASINDAPTNSVPGPQTVSEDTALVFSATNGNAISIADADAGTAAMQITLSVSNGTTTLSQTTGLTFVTGTGTGNPTMTFTGTIANVNAALNGLRFNANANYSGAASLQIVTNDLGSSGAGGALTATSNVAITVTPANDAPVNSVPGPQGTAQNTVLVFSVTNGNAITVSDIDAGPGALVVTLSASNGTLTLGSQVGLSSVTGDGTGTVVMSGTIANVNSALNGLGFLPSFNFGGPASVQLSTDDQGNSGTGGALIDTDVININVSGNVSPVVVTTAPPLAYTENAPASVIDAGVTVGDADSPLLAQAVVRVAVAYNSSEDVLAFTNQLGIVGSWDAGTGTLTLTGSASAADFQTALRSVTYQNLSENPDTTSRLITFTVNDGIADGAAAARSIAITAVNDAPTTSAPLTQAVNEDTALVFSAGNGNAITVGDPDSGTSPLQVTFTAANATINLAQVNGLTIVSGSDGSSALTVSGTVSDLNAALNGLTFHPNAGFNGVAGLNISTDDLGNTGSGGASTSSAAVTITVAAANDAPTGTNSSLTTLEDSSYVFSAADFGFSDPSETAPNNLAAVRFSTLPSLGTLTDNGIALTAGQFVSVADIGAGRLIFNPDKDTNGVGYASFTFQVQDDGGTANGGVDLDPTPRTMLVNVTAVNDAPVGADGAVTTVENTAYTFTASDFSFNDPNDAPANALASVTIASLPAVGSLTLSGTAITAGQVISAANIAAGNLRFAPAANTSGAVYSTFTFQLQDDGGTANGGAALEATPHTMTIDVSPINHAPQGSDVAITALQDTPYTFNSTAFGFSDVNDTPANNLLTVKIISLPGAGTLMDNGVAVSVGQLVSRADIDAGYLRFHPELNATGVGYATFGFQLQDDGGTAGGGVDLDPTVHVISINVSPTPASPVTPPVIPTLPPSTGPTPPSVSVAPPSSIPVGSTTTDPKADDDTTSTASTASSGSDAEPQSATTAMTVENETPKPSHPSGAVLNSAGGGSNHSASHTEFQKTPFQLASLLDRAVPPPDAAAFDAMKPDQPYTLTADPAALAAYKSTLRNDHWVGELNHMRDDVDEQISLEKKIVGSTVAVTGSVSIGYVMWLLRGGVLVSSLLSSLPAWHIIDPMPVLSGAKRKDDREAENDDPLEKLFSRAKAVIARGRKSTKPGSTVKDNDYTLPA